MNIETNRDNKMTLVNKESIKIVNKGDIALVEFDLPGEKVNKLSSPVMKRLKEVVEELKASSYKAAILISRKKKIFIAGADIEEIKRLKTKEEYKLVLDEAHLIFNALEDLKIPTIAAIHGACMGGGCELILACDYRIATTDKSTKIGLPEVKLGIFPGFGGCIRLPRVVGLQSALDIILAGKSVISKKALKIGLIDKAVPAELLEEQAMILANEIVSGKKSKRQKTFKAKGVANKLLDGPLKSVVYKQARKMTLKQSKGFYPAPIAALDVIKKTYKKMKREKALAVEVAAFCEVAITDISKHLINLFFMMEGIKKKTGVADTSVKPLPVKDIAVMGAGTMGGGIAYVAADKGIATRMKDISNEALAIGFGAARKIWNKKLKRRRITKYDLDQKMNLISGGLDFASFQSKDVVIEAIVEDMKIKKMVLAQTEAETSENCIIATNTSSLSVNEMGVDLKRPENFLGMHFFNPVDKMPLVEVIRGEKTSDEAVATIFDLSKRMGKTPVVVKDSVGFLVNRLLLPWMSEAVYMLEEGCDMAKIDRYYTHKFGMPMGPFRLMDEVGLDVCVKIIKIFNKALGDRFEVPAIVQKLSESDRLGNKNKKGFYKYNEKGRAEGIDESVYTEFGVTKGSANIDEKQAIERGMFRMINEASRALIEEKVVETAGECDLAMIMGTGFPPFRGGLLKYADELGSDYVVGQLEVYASKYGKRFEPSQAMNNLAKSKRSFY